jgi:hypothetical protein
MMKKNQRLFNRFTKCIKPLILFVLCVFGSTTNPVFAQTWDEIIKIVASDRNESAVFGHSVAISGDYAIVGSYGEDHDTIGGDFLNRAGAAYILKNNEGTWTEVQKLVASDRDIDDRFGYSVAISGDYAVVSAYLGDDDTSGGAFIEDAGAAYIFKNDAGTWVEVQKIVASDRDEHVQFGISVAISGDYAIVGAHYEDYDTTGGFYMPGAGAAYIFINYEGTWSEAKKLVASDRGAFDLFGNSVAISGDCAIVGAIMKTMMN